MFSDISPLNEHAHEKSRRPDADFAAESHPRVWRMFKRPGPFVLIMLPDEPPAYELNDPIVCSVPWKSHTDVPKMEHVEGV